jgi:hypothetical protein
VALNLTWPFIYNDFHPFCYLFYATLGITFRAVSLRQAVSDPGSERLPD